MPPTEKLKVHKSQIVGVKNNGVMVASIAIDGTLALMDPSRTFSIRACDPFNAIPKSLVVNDSHIVATAVDGSTFIFKFGKGDKQHPL
jgi:hypothetical protein